MNILQLDELQQNLLSLLDNNHIHWKEYTFKDFLLFKINDNDKFFIRILKHSNELIHYKYVYGMYFTINMVPFKKRNIIKFIKRLKLKHFE